MSHRAALPPPLTDPAAPPYCRPHGARPLRPGCHPPHLRQCADNDASDATPEVLSVQQGAAEWPGGDQAAGTLRLNTDPPRSTLAEQTETLGLGALA